MALPLTYEGTVDEIVEQMHSGKLTGRLKVIIMPDEYGAAGTDSSETLDTALAALLAEADCIQWAAPVSLIDPQEKAFGEIVDEKYRIISEKSVRGPNLKAAAALQEIAERQKIQPYSDGSDTLRLIREARGGAMYDYDTAE